MKPVYVRVVLLDATAGDRARNDGTHVFEGIEVDIARIKANRPERGDDVLRLEPDPATRLFVANVPSYEVSSSHVFRVGFLRRNFSKATGTLLSPDQVTEAALPLSVPSRLPYWDSGWSTGYAPGEFLDGDIRTDSSPDRPITLRVPMRRLYLTGHRGAPFLYPENTLASFKAALDLGANALEFDICLTRDKRLVVFHDPSPDVTRIWYEDYPYELASPEIDGDMALIKALKDGEYSVVRRRHHRTRDKLDILKLTLKEVRTFYRYTHVRGEEHAIPSLEEVLAFCSAEKDRLELLYLDIKNPLQWGPRARARHLAFGKALGSTLREFPSLPERLIVANMKDYALEELRKGVRSVGETRCQYAIDSSGGVFQIFGLKRNATAVAREMNTDVVSVGARFRAGDRKEIAEAVWDRDHNPASAITTVVHWTINSPSGMYRSIAAGVNGIVTDKPDVMAGVLRENGLYVRPPKTSL
jgi:glycerophosphoryl diester phosphodiesterase